MTTATETQPTIRETKTMMRHANDCNTQVSGWAGEICNCHPREHTESTPTQPSISLSNFRVVYHAPRYEDGRVLYDGYCAILADDAALDGAEVRVFDVPDVDEGQLAAAMFACDAMNQHERYVKLLEAAKLLLAMNNCNYDRDQMRKSGGFDAVAEAVEAIQLNWAKSAATTTSK